MKKLIISMQGMQQPRASLVEEAVAQKPIRLTVPAQTLADSAACAERKALMTAEEQRHDDKPRRGGAHVDDHSSRARINRKAVNAVKRVCACVIVIELSRVLWPRVCKGRFHAILVCTRSCGRRESAARPRPEGGFPINPSVICVFALSSG